MLPGQGWGWGRRDPSRVYLPIWESPSGSDRSPQPMLNLATWIGMLIRRNQQCAALRAFNRSFLDSWIRQIGLPSVVRGRQDKTRQALPFPADTTLAPQVPTVKLFSPLGIAAATRRGLLLVSRTARSIAAWRRPASRSP